MSQAASSGWETGFQGWLNQGWLNQGFSKKDSRYSRIGGHFDSRAGVGGGAGYERERVVVRAKAFHREGRKGKAAKDAKKIATLFVMRWGVLVIFCRRGFLVTLGCETWGAFGEPHWGCWRGRRSKLRLYEMRHV